jgi:hypothetical protein
MVASQLLGVVSEEAHRPIAFRAHVAHLSLVPLRMKTRLEHAMRVKARIAIKAAPILVIRAV